MTDLLTKHIITNIRYKYKKRKEKYNFGYFKIQNHIVSKHSS